MADPIELTKKPKTVGIRIGRTSAPAGATFNLCRRLLHKSVLPDIDAVAEAEGASAQAISPAAPLVGD